MEGTYIVHTYINSCSFNNGPTQCYKPEEESGNLRSKNPIQALFHHWGPKALRLHSLACKYANRVNYCKLIGQGEVKAFTLPARPYILAHAS